MANYSRIQDICKAFGLDDDYAYVIFETYENTCCKPTKQQWQALQNNLKSVGLKATATAFNAYNQVAARVECERNNEVFAAYR